MAQPVKGLLANTRIQLDLQQLWKKLHTVACAVIPVLEEDGDKRTLSQFR